MLRITVCSPESWDEHKQEFIPPKELATLQLEHSLVSLSKWESKWCKPFLHSPDMSDEEILDYIKCMTLTQNVDPSVYNYLSIDNILEIRRYIDAPMTATTFSTNSTVKKKKQIVTAELIYCWMINLHIPVEFQKWHLNKLITLIRVCEDAANPPKKKSKSETINEYAALNEARRKLLNSKG